MGLNLKVFVLALSFGATAGVQAFDGDDKNYFTINKVTLSEVSSTFLEPEKMSTVYEKEMNVQGLPNAAGQVSANPEKVGKIIAIGRDLVALGEDIYRLVIKGKPTNTTSYAPISVIPKINNQPADIFDTENWSLPVKRTYQIVYKNLYGMDVVTFRYSIIYSYNGSYNGTGAYLTAVQIVPEYSRTLFGFDFTATMKLGGIINQGTKAYPVAGATLLMEYTVSSVLVANNQVDTYFVNGRGGFKAYK